MRKVTDERSEPLRICLYVCHAMQAAIWDLSILNLKRESAESFLVLIECVAGVLNVCKNVSFCSKLRPHKVTL